MKYKNFENSAFFKFAKEQVNEVVSQVIDTAVTKLREKLSNLANQISSKVSSSIFDESNSSQLEQPTKSSMSGDLIISEKQNTNSYSTIESETGVIQVTENMNSIEEDMFLESISKSLTAVGLSSIKNPLQAAEVVKTLIVVAGEVSKFQELQITKRAEIESLRQQALAKIEMQKELLTTYLEKTFDERKDIFKQQFKIVDAAISNGNIQQLAIGLNSINELATTSPFKDLASVEEVHKALNNKDTVWEF